MSLFSIDRFIETLRERSPLFDEKRAIPFKKGADIFTQGTVCTDVFILCSGLVKLHYITLDGKEWVKSFIMDRGLMGSRASLELGEPSPYSATCLEDCRLIPVAYTDFNALCMDNADLSQMALQLFQWLSLKKEMREHDLLCLSAEDRYIKFHAENAALTKRITQTDMARFLGITPIALSRIKKRVSAS